MDSRGQLDPEEELYGDRVSLNSSVEAYFRSGLALLRLDDDLQRTGGQIHCLRTQMRQPPQGFLPCEVLLSLILLELRLALLLSS